MQKLNRYELDFQVTLKYFKDNLEGTNTLCSRLINSTNFISGKFFTLLPPDSNLKNIHKFQYGGMTTGVKKQVRHLILEKLRSDEKLCCLFDNVSSEYKEGCDDSLFLFCGLNLGKEIYYLVTQKTASLELMDRCFYASNAIWHSLCVLFRFESIDLDKKTLNIHEIDKICGSVELILISSYDDEGYVFWEKSGSSFFA